MDGAKFGGQETIQTKDATERLTFRKQAGCFFGTIGKDNLLHKDIWR